MSARVDDLGRAYAGSQLQIQIYVNRRTEELNQSVLDALFLTSLNARLCWVSPLESEKFVEYQDEAFLRALGLQHLAGQLREFWPRRGPSWDALAVVRIGGDLARWGAVLVEAKSHPAELRGEGCRARPRPRARIEARLRETKRWLSVAEAEDVDWTEELYQSANRLAHLYFFLRAGIPVWLVNVYFLRDPHFPDSPSTREEWDAVLSQVKADLGVKTFVPHTADVFLEARDRRELVRPTDAETGGG